MPDYKAKANNARKKVLQMIHKGGTSHISSNFSIIDVLTVLFEDIDLDKDKLVMSCGWKAASLYYFLYTKGRITEDELNSFCQPGSKFIGLTEPITKDIQFAGGSMGLGLPAAVGFALSKKIKGEKGRIFCIVSDGEVGIGTMWESILIAKHQRLDNLTIIVDRNFLQAMGSTEDVLALEPLKNKFEAFGLNTIEIDGHNFSEIDSAIHKSGLNMIIAKTVKGRGVSFMEGNNLWHYLRVDKDTYEKALAELS